MRKEPKWPEYREPTLDDYLRASFYQRTYGPHQPGAIATIEAWERKAISLLDGFIQRDVPDDNTHSFPVCGRWRYYEYGDEKTEDCLFNLGEAFWAIHDAFEELESFAASPGSVDKLTLVIIQLTYCCVRVSIMRDEIWIRGEREAVRAARLRIDGAKAAQERKKFNTPKKVAALEHAHSRHWEKPNWLQETTDELRTKWGIDASTKVVSNAVKMKKRREKLPTKP